MQRLELALILVIALASPGLMRGDEPPRPETSDQAWSHLPTRDTARQGPLPVWARITARSLPRTTTAMLELDWRHRTQSPLDPVLRAKMRYVAAAVNRSPYALATARGDLARLGATDAQIADLDAGETRWPADQRACLILARDLTRDGATVTDARVAAVRESLGDERLVAAVLLIAHANFQDRLFLALGVTPEVDGPLPPIEVHLDPTARIEPPPRSSPPLAHIDPSDVPTHVDDPTWNVEALGSLKQGLESQRSAVGRIRVPSFDEMLSRLPADAPRPPAPIGVKWTLVCSSYQPRLALGWSACTRSFRDDAQQDRVFEESLFWVVTRAIHCFY
jgi:hypothetical protein